MQQQPPPNSQPLPPVLLPSGWVETWDATQQRNYYYHAETRATQWERPVPAVVPLPPPPLPRPLPLPPTVHTVPQPTGSFDPRRRNDHNHGSMRNPHGRDDAAHHQHSQQQQPQPQPQLQAQYPYPAQVPPQQLSQYQQPVAQQPQQQHQCQSHSHPQYYQQQQIPYRPGQQQYPPQQQQQQWNNPTPHVITLQQQQQYPNHRNTKNDYSYNLAGNAMMRTAPVTAAAGAVGAPSDPPPQPSLSIGCGGTGIYNAQQEFDELRAMTTGQIALLCKLQQHEQEQAHEKQDQNNTNDGNENETETTTEETEDAASSSKSNAQARYTPIALSSLAYVSLAHHRTEPGRLIALLCKLQHELELHEQNNTPEET